MAQPTSATLDWEPWEAFARAIPFLPFTELDFSKFWAVADHVEVNLGSLKFGLRDISGWALVVGPDPILWIAISN